MSDHTVTHRHFLKSLSKGWLGTAILCHTCYTAPVSSFTGFSNMTGDTAAGLEITSFEQGGRSEGEEEISHTNRMITHCVETHKLK